MSPAATGGDLRRRVSLAASQQLTAMPPECRPALAVSRPGGQYRRFSGSADASRSRIEEQPGASPCPGGAAAPKPYRPARAGSSAAAASRAVGTATLSRGLVEGQVLRPAGRPLISSCTHSKAGRARRPTARPIATDDRLARSLRSPRRTQPPQHPRPPEALKADLQRRTTGATAISISVPEPGDTAMPEGDNQRRLPAFAAHRRRSRSGPGVTGLG
jgi:hypothetical protein